MADHSSDQGKALRELCIEFAGSGVIAGVLAGCAHAAAALTGSFDGPQRLAAALAAGLAMIMVTAAAFRATGGQFNPLLSFAYGLTGKQPWYRTLYFPLFQVAGALAGTMAANNFAMGVLWQAPEAKLSGEPWLIAEWLTGLILVMTAFAFVKDGGRRYAAALATVFMGAFVLSGGETLANPALTFARCMTESGIGIRLDQLLPVILAQFGGAAAGFAGARIVFVQEKAR